MQEQKVNSRAIESLAYDAERQNLYVRFHAGTVGCYLSVPLETVLAFLDARSKGGFLNREIKKRFSYRLATEDEMKSCSIVICKPKYDLSLTGRI